MSTDRGSIRWHRGGWELRARAHGRQVTRRHRAPNTRSGRRSAEDALDRLLQELAIGVDGDSMTVGELVELYALTKSSSWSMSTRASHRSHVIPVLDAYGSTPVAQLTRADIIRTNASWLAAGRTAGTVRRRHTILSAALAYAETELEIIAASPTRGITLPSIERTPTDLPSMTDALEAIDEITHRHLRVLARIAVATGARRGEILALRWPDLDLDADVPAVLFAAAISADSGDLERKSTKTGRLGQRRVSLDPETVQVLRAWRTELLELAMAAGLPRPGATTPVVPSPPDPTAVWIPDQVTARWRTARKASVLAHVRLHDLRHLHATTLLAAGVPVPVVAARLGHASTQMTLDRYGHAIPAQDQMAAQVIADAGTIGGSISSSGG